MNRFHVRQFLCPAPLLRRDRGVVLLAASLSLAASLVLLCPCPAAERFDGRYFRGAGDVEYLQLLEIARRMYEPDPEFQSIAMLYNPGWNGFVEGPTWGAWWIQNSYGPTYCSLPFWQEPYVTFVQNSQDLWFSQMGDGKRKGWQDMVAPDGCLCDCASPGSIIYKQGDGRVNLHDWGMEFTAAGLVMQSELLLVSRDPKAIAHYLSRLERVANFIETRRDPKNNLFLAGPAGNLLAPSYAAWKKPDGTYDKAYLAGLSITYIAGLDRLIELEKMAGNADKAKLYAQRRELARKGLPLLTTDEGYFVKYMDPDGTKHGVYGAPKHGYFEAICNHDAICFRVADDAQSRKIYEKIASIPGLRRHDLIVTNCPSLDDMYESPAGLWAFGHWVNGGHWSTCEARMMMGYYRLGRQDDARRSMKRILGFARQFRMDNNLTNFGSQVYQPNEPINCVYDTWGVPAALIRGLFEYLYQADGLTILPHVPPGITELQQRFPIRFGRKQLYLSTSGTGPVTAVTINGQAWKTFDAGSIQLPYERTPDRAVLLISLGGAAVPAFEPPQADCALPPAPSSATIWRPKDFPVVATNNLPLRIGADSEGGNLFHGEMADPRVYSRALAADEIGRLVQGRSGDLDKAPALVGRWMLDKHKDRVVPNAAVEQLPAKIVGQAKLVDGPQGKAVQLGGEGFLEVANDPRLHLTGGLTLAIWIRPDQLPPRGARLIDKCKAGFQNGYMLDTHPGNSLRFLVERGGLTLDAKLRVDRWTHVAVTVDAGGSQTMYVDGKAVAARPVDPLPDLTSLAPRVARLRAFHEQLVAASLGEGYEAAHARLVVRYFDTCHRRMKMLADGELKPLASAESQYAADKSYLATTLRHCEGLEKVLESYAKSDDSHRRRVYQMWAKAAGRK
jgi:hypothetical protein